MVLSLRAKPTPYPIEVVLEKFLEKFTASMKTWNDQFVEAMKQPQPKSDTKHDRKVLICGYMEEEDCFCVATEINETEYNLDDTVDDVEFDEKNDDQNLLQIQQDDEPVIYEVGANRIIFAVGDRNVSRTEIGDFNPQIHQVFNQLDHPKVNSLPIYDFSSPKMVVSTVERVFVANKKISCVEDKVFDESPERDGYIPMLNPKPPDECGSPLIIGIWEHVNNYNYQSEVPTPAMRVLQNQYNYLVNKHIESEFKTYGVAIKLCNQISRLTQKGEICSSLATRWFKLHGNSGLDTSAINKNSEILIGWLLEPLEQGDCSSDMKALLKNGFSIYCEVEKILMQIHDDEAFVLYDKLFSYACPKYIVLFAPTYEKPFVNCKLDSYKLQLKPFPYEMKQKQLLHVVQIFLKVYLIYSLGKLATYMEVDEFALRAFLMTCKHKIHVDLDGNVVSTIKLGASFLLDYWFSTENLSASTGCEVIIHNSRQIIIGTSFTKHMSLRWLQQYVGSNCLIGCDYEQIAAYKFLGFSFDPGGITLLPIFGECRDYLQFHLKDKVGVDRWGNGTELIETNLVDVMGDVFPKLKQYEEHIGKTIAAEEKSFGRMLVNGIEKIKRATQDVQGKIIGRQDGILLWDTYGFPWDLTQLMAEERGLVVDVEGFNKAMNEATLSDDKRVNGLRALFGEIYPDPVKVGATGKKVEDLLENPENNEWSLISAKLCGETHISNTREFERKSIVLLKNSKSADKPLIPLPKKTSKILVAGSHADNIGNQCGGWTIVWQGQGGNITIGGNTIPSSIKKTIAPGIEVVYKDNSDVSFVKFNKFSYAIVVVGEPHYAEIFGDNMNLTIPTAGFNTIKKCLWCYEIFCCPDFWPSCCY